MSSRWTHRACERCWFDGPGQNEDGTFRVPAQYTGADPGPCCFCGGLAITGIFLRVAPEALRCGGNHEDLGWSQVGLSEVTSS